MTQLRRKASVHEFETTETAVEDRLVKLYDRLKYDRERYLIEPKPFTVTDVSQYGIQYLSLENGQQYSFSGIRATDRFGVLGRSFFFPQAVQLTEDRLSRRFIEVKGYGADGGEMCAWSHCEGDILFGMFYQNAKKEYDILKKAADHGLKVPMPLLLGEINKEVWWNSALGSISKINEDEQFSIEEIRDYKKLPISEIESKLKKALKLWPIGKNPLSAFKQPYNAGVVIRAVQSPIRMGDPTDIYIENERNISIAIGCGQTFWKLLDLGYFHDTPGTCNFTTEGELTDMADCHDLGKVNLDKLISKREKSTGLEFWKDILSPRYTSNLSPFFIEGMLGKRTNLNKAAKILEEKVRSFIKK